jgi:YbbR domain-containing protein
MSSPDTNKSLFARSIVRKLFFEDWPLKLTALGITLGLWMMVTGLSSPTTKRLTVPLNLSISSNAQITNATREEVDIEISGDKRKIDQINRSELAATVDLTDLEPGERVVSLNPTTVFVQLPQGVRVTEVAPSRIAVNLEAVAEKDVEVRADSKGKPAAGYEVYSVSVLPPSIQVRGPASVVRTLDFVRTDQIDIAGKKEDFTARQVAVRSPNPQADVLNTFVDVVFRIGERRIERMFSVDVLGTPGKTATFVLYGPRVVLAKLRSELFVVEMTKDQNGVETPHVVLPTELQDVVEVRDLKVD